MSQPIVEAAVEARLKAAWTACPIFLENEKAQPPEDGGAFLRLEFATTSNRRLFLGDAVYREDGAIRIGISVEKLAGMTKVQAYGAQIAAIFRDQAFGGVVCKVPLPPRTDERATGGNYFVAWLIVPYHFFYRA